MGGDMENLAEQFAQVMPSGRRRTGRRGAVSGEEMEQLAKKVAGMRVGARVAGGGGRRMAPRAGAVGSGARAPAQTGQQLVQRYHPYRRQSWSWMEESGSDPMVDPFLNQVVEIEANGCVFRGKLIALTKPPPRSGRGAAAAHNRAVKLAEVTRVGTPAPQAGALIKGPTASYRIFHLNDVAALNIPMPLCPPRRPISSPCIEVLDASEDPPLPPSPHSIPLPQDNPYASFRAFRDPEESTMEGTTEPALAGMDLLAFILNNMNIRHEGS
eukprot:TRINITY_DN3231_c0_g3_i2.p1 TRINITY_DN3231_c0_g3~~TRINITY_DN3231_c0_g3_i2.p1  ORF type:complete len:270 (+),score=62.63 TRINITY_DN3231_c0_g3_i2:60-869(+)